MKTWKDFIWRGRDFSYFCRLALQCRDQEQHWNQPYLLNHFVCWIYSLHKARIWSQEVCLSIYGYFVIFLNVLAGKLEHRVWLSAQEIVGKPTLCEELTPDRHSVTIVGQIKQRVAVFLLAVTENSCNRSNYKQFLMLSKVFRLCYGRKGKCNSSLNLYSFSCIDVF